MKKIGSVCIGQQCLIKTDHKIDVPDAAKRWATKIMLIGCMEFTQAFHRAPAMHRQPVHGRASARARSPARSRPQRPPSSVSESSVEHLTQQPFAGDCVPSGHRRRLGTAPSSSSSLHDPAEPFIKINGPLCGPHDHRLHHCQRQLPLSDFQSARSPSPATIGGRRWLRKNGDTPSYRPVPSQRPAMAGVDGHEARRCTLEIRR